MRPYILLLSLFILYLPHEYKLASRLGEFQGLNAFNLLLPLLFVGSLTGSSEEASPLRMPKRLRWAVILFFAAWLISFIASLMISDDQLTHFIEFKRQALPVLIFPVIVWASKNRSDRRALQIAFLAGVVLVGLEILMDGVLLGPSYSDHKRGSGPFGHGLDGSDVAGGYLAQFLPFLFAGFLWERTLASRIIMLIGFCVGLLGLLVTYSRGSWLALLISLLVLLTMRNWKLLPIILVALLSLWGILPESVRARLSMTEVASDRETQLDESSRGRINYWESALNIAMDHPFGVGFNRIKEYMSSYSSKRIHVDSHNTYLQIAVEMGLLGLLLFLWMLACFGWRAWKIYRTRTDPISTTWAGGAVGCLVAFLIVNMFYSNFFRDTVVGSFWVAMGLALVAHTPSNGLPRQEGEAK